jgi:hypothetical protein
MLRRNQPSGNGDILVPGLFERAVGQPPHICADPVVWRCSYGRELHARSLGTESVQRGPPKLRRPGTAINSPPTQVRPLGLIKLGRG